MEEKKLSRERQMKLLDITTKFARIGLPTISIILTTLYFSIGYIYATTQFVGENDA